MPYQQPVLYFGMRPAVLLFFPAAAGLPPRLTSKSDNGGCPMGQQYENQSRDCALQNRFTGYLQTALKRKKRDYIRKQVRKRAYDFPADFQATQFADSSEYSVDRNRQDLSQLEDTALAQALSKLTARNRFILFERVLNGSSYDTLAEILGLRSSGVASAYHSIIKKLRKELRCEDK